MTFQFYKKGKILNEQSGLTLISISDLFIVYKGQKYFSSDLFFLKKSKFLDKMKIYERRFLNIILFSFLFLKF